MVAKTIIDLHLLEKTFLSHLLRISSTFTSFYLGFAPSSQSPRAPVAT